MAAYDSFDTENTPVDQGPGEYRWVGGDSGDYVFFPQAAEAAPVVNTAPTVDTSSAVSPQQISAADQGPGFYTETGEFRSIAPAGDPINVIANAWNQGDIGTVNQQIASTNMTEQQAAQTYNLSAADIANAKAEGVKFATDTGTTDVGTTGTSKADTGTKAADTTTTNTTAGTTKTTGTTAGTTAETTATTTTKPASVVDYQGNSFDTKATLGLASQVANAFDKTSSSGAAFSTSGQSIGFDYDQAKAVFGKDPTAAQQVLLDMSRSLQQAGVTNLNDVGVRTVPVDQQYGEGEFRTVNQQEFYNTKTGQTVADQSGAFGETYTGKGKTIYALKQGDDGKVKVYTRGEDTSDAGMVNAALTMASFVPALAPFAQLAKTGIALGQGNLLGAGASLFNIPGVSDVLDLPSISSLNIPGINSVGDAFKLGTAISNNNLLDAATILSGSSDLQLASKAINVLKAIDSGNVNAVMSAASGMAGQLNKYSGGGKDSGQQVVAERARGGSVRGGLGTVSRHIAAQRIAASKPNRPPIMVDVSRLKPLNKPQKQATIGPVDVSILIPIKRSA